MPRVAQGGAFESRGKLFARVTVAPKKRRAVLLTSCATLEQATRHAQQIQDLVGRLRESGHARGIEKTLAKAAKLDAEGLRKLARLVDRIATGKEPAPWDQPAITIDGETFEAFAMSVRGELAAFYPDHVERKRSAYTDLCILRKYVFPALTGRPIASIVIEDYERVMREIPERAGARKLRSGPRRHVA